MITESQIADFAKAVETMRVEYAASQGYSNFIADVGYSMGKRYAKLMVANGGQLNGSVFCFVDLSNGNILKAASWSTPAKGARGNIANRAADLTPHGAQYRR